MSGHQGPLGRAECGAECGRRSPTAANSPPCFKAPVPAQRAARAHQAPGGTPALLPPPPHPTLRAKPASKEGRRARRSVSCRPATALGSSGWGGGLARPRAGLRWGGANVGGANVGRARTLGRQRGRWGGSETLRAAKDVGNILYSPSPKEAQRGHTAESPLAVQLGQVGRHGNRILSTRVLHPGGSRGPGLGYCRAERPLGDAGGPRRLATGFPQPWRAPCSGRCPLLTLAMSTFHCCSA